MSIHSEVRKCSKKGCRKLADWTITQHSLRQEVDFCDDHAEEMAQIIKDWGDEKKTKHHHRH